MLKLKLTKDEHSKLPAPIQAEYSEEGGNYTLDTDVSFEDVTPLKNALKAEKEHRRTATAKATELEGQLTTTSEELTTLKARAGQPTDLEKSWQAKLDKANGEAKLKQDGLTKHLHTLLVDNVATTLAGEVATVPSLLLPHIKARLSVAEEDGAFITRVLDAEGKPSALSVNELKAELVATKEFASIIKASQASGGGAQGSKRVAGGKAFKDMAESERTSLYKENPAEYRRLRDAGK